MRVTAPADKSTRAIEADWVELQVLVTDADVTEQQLIRSQSVQSEPDHGDVTTDLDHELADEEILEPRADELSQRVLEELTYRENALGELYPFRLDAQYGKWVLRRRETAVPATQAAHGCYVCCLLITAMRSELLPIAGGHGLLTESAHVMQIESYLTAAEILGGSAYWFGFPRPDHTGMLAAVQKLVAAMGLGHAPDERPAGVPPHAADGTVDIVAWRPFRDGQPAAVVAYGQVASGRNWESKPIRAFIAGNFLAWFIRPPSQQHVELLFIPFLQHHNLEESRSRDFWNEAREQAHVRSMNFGVVIDRLRLTELMAASKVNGRYESQEYQDYEATAQSWMREALEYASGGGG